MSRVESSSANTSPTLTSFACFNFPFSTKYISYFIDPSTPTVVTPHPSLFPEQVVVSRARNTSARNKTVYVQMENLLYHILSSTSRHSPGP